MELKQVVSVVFTEVSDTMHNLSMRWEDEKEYEDIEDYRKVLQSKTSVPISAMTKRPFGFKTNINGVNLHFFIKKSRTTQELVAKKVG